ncbi:MAG: hypothetical protein CR988_01805 [Treponema sp.]|nr:MAG: hypothetical protein CR988_01805 [Treponema sp.]
MVRNLYAKRMEEVLRTQIGVIDSIYTLQKKIHQFVMERDWISTQEGITSLNKLSGEFAECDKRAAQIISDSSGNSDMAFNFENFTENMPKSEKAGLNTLYKSLKERIFLSKIENDVFNSYVSHAKDLVEGVFCIVADNRKGQTYTRTGVMASGDMSNLVVDTVF